MGSSSCPVEVHRHAYPTSWLDVSLCFRLFNLWEKLKSTQHDGDFLRHSLLPIRMQTVRKRC